jgi:TatD DNase family protein
MIDTHCHLTDPRLLEQLQAVVERAQAAGVSRMITIGTNADDDAAAVALCKGREFLRCAVGIHPNYTHEAQFEDLDRVREIQNDPSVVALGEMGLDYFHSFSDRTRQREFFNRQMAMALALEVNKPVVIHCREAVDDTLALMHDFPQVRAVFHCFTGTLDEARKIIDAGYLLGFTGPITYKKNDALRQVVNFVPQDRMLVETDAPYLTPEPMRKQKTNEPALVMHVAETVGRVRGLSVDEVDRITTENAARFFGW